jgi:hypothetical protein
MLIVALDFDGTVADTNFVKSEWIKNNLGLTIPPYQCDRTSCLPIIGTENYNKMGRYVYSESCTINIPIADGCMEIITKLKSIGQLFIVTARTGERLLSASEWLSKYEETKDVNVMGVDTTLCSKLEKCRENNVSILIDDDERHLLNSQNFEICGILFKKDAPNDFVSIYKNICSSWEEISKCLKL